MAWEVIWLPSAGAEFCCAVHDVSRVHPGAAERLRTGVDRRLRLAARHPLIFKQARASADPAVREFYVPPYRIFYRVLEQEKKLAVLCVWHGARRDPDLPD